MNSLEFIGLPAVRFMLVILLLHLTFTWLVYKLCNKTLQRIRLQHNKLYKPSSKLFILIVGLALMLLLLKVLYDYPIYALGGRGSLLYEYEYIGYLIIVIFFPYAIIAKKYLSEFEPIFSLRLFILSTVLCAYALFYIATMVVLLANIKFPG